MLEASHGSCRPQRETTDAGFTIEHLGEGGPLSGSSSRPSRPTGRSWVPMGSPCSKRFVTYEDDVKSARCQAVLC